ncbi:ABC transporter permease [Arthrobacter sp. E3]|uniref:ABC transporter permease n=1 Tax=Arthrobacter sp. E3 TaxID=517402 RepID=UPI001A94A366|nr:ABC transporter permease [Arthrobacter sp. E3]
MLFHDAPAGQAASLTSRILNQGKYEAATMLRNGEQLVLMVVMPLLGLVALVATPLLDGMGHPRVAIAAPGILALCALSTAFTGQGIATGFDRRYGVLRFLSTTPLGKAGLIAGKVLAVLVALALQVALISMVAVFMGWRPPLAGVLLGIPLLVLGAAAFTALGLLIAGTVRPEATLAITNLGWILFAALGGIVLPAGKFSSALEGFVQWLPSGALGNLMRAALIDSRLDVWGLIVLLAWAAVASFAAVKWFKWN